MANWTKAQLASAALEFIGVKAAGQSASSEDQATAETVTQSVYDQFRKPGLTGSFAISAVPAWAQQPMKKAVASELAPEFGLTGQRLAEFQRLGQLGQRDIYRQMAVLKQSAPIKADYM